MLNRYLVLAALGGLLALPACTSGQARAEPPYTPVNVGNTAKLQFQVGTANYTGAGGGVFLNTVVTYRQPDGLSALLDSTPNIALPFTNTAPAAAGSNNDFGKNQITGTVQTNNGVASTDPRTFSQSVGAFSYGFLASNSSTTGGNNSVFYPSSNAMPYYAAAAGVPKVAYYVGPGNSMVSNFNNGSIGTVFDGYPSGFTTFALTPTTGTYTLTVGLPNASTPIPTFTSTTTMATVTPLPAMPAPVFTPDGAGGGTVTQTVPPGVTETMIELEDTSAYGAVGTSASCACFFTLIVHGSGAQTATLADNLGTVTNGGTAGPSIAPGDHWAVTSVGFDYPAMEAVPVGSSPPQAPVINNSGTACTFSGTSSTCPGQADLTVSATVTDASAGGTTARSRRGL